MRSVLVLLGALGLVLASLVSHGRPRAALVTLASSDDIDAMVSSMHDIESGFNNNHGYDWCFFSTFELSIAFKEAVSNATPAVCTFDVIPDSHQSSPTGIDCFQESHALL